MKFKDIEKYASEMQKFKIKCKCSHTVIIPYNVDLKICSYCGHYVFKDKKTEFKYKMNKALKEVK